MISNLETIFGHSNPALIEQVRRQDTAFTRDFLERLTRPLPTGQPFEWIISAVHIKTPTIDSPFDPAGRQYMREPINNVNETDIREETDCMATGSAKTLMAMLRWVWAMQHQPFSGLWINPAKEGSGGARQFNQGNLIPTIEHTKCFADKLPTGIDRHNFAGLKLRFAGNDIDLVGGNSPTQLAAKRCHRVHLDEQDKLKEKLGREGSADQLAVERTKQVAPAQITRGSTPTLENFGIWPHLMRSDLRRRFVTCPHCNPSAKFDLQKYFVIVKDHQFTVMPDKFDFGTDYEPGTKIPMAELRWDKEAKKQHGGWDEDRVIRSARYECPHCHGHIRDHHRNWLDQHGVWLPTRAALGHRGYHLPVFYTPQVDFSSSIGGIAKKFLDALESGSIGGVINSDYAEVNAAQQHSTGTITVGTKPMAAPDWIALLTADFHKNAPYIWFTVRKWCAFKLLPPVPITDGLPEFVPLLDLHGNESAKAKCLKLIGCNSESMTAEKYRPAWHTIGELFRFKTTDIGESPIFDFLIAQKITGDKLVKLFKADAEGSTLEYRRIILARMFEHQHGMMSPEEFRKFRAPRGGDSELIAAGNLDTSGPRLWEDLRDIETEFKVGQGLTLDRRAVYIDCGFQEKFDAEVLQQCYERATWFKWYLADSPKHAPTFHGTWEKGGEPPRAIQGRPCVPCAADGWQPIKGIPTLRPMGDGGKLSRDLSVRIADPFYGTGQPEGTRVIEVLNIPQMLFWHRRQELRSGRTKNTWTISPNVSWFPKHYDTDGTRTHQSSYRLEDYLKQSDGQYWDERTKKVEPKGGRGGSQSKRNPYHVDDCDTYQVAAATHLEFFETASATGQPANKTI